MDTQGTESSASSKQENEEADILGQKPGFESFFRDGARKIDLMLVLDDTKDRYFESIKIEFLINIIDVGLELELETGTMAKLKHLIFVKVHTPDDLIKEYGRNFDIFKMFRSSHTEFIDPNMTYEREWLDLMRVQYPGPENFSTAERSQVTYSLLQKIQTGEADNKFGLNRLLAYKIILDAYPLHDGPYFFVPRQRYYEPNGRQILFLGWTGYQNLFRRQPLHVIREYMGERVAFLFAFFQFYILAQPIFVALGGGLFAAGFYDTKNTETIERQACTDVNGLDTSHPIGTFICPKCHIFNACPFRTIKQYCEEIKFKVYVDNLNMVPFTPLVCICAIVVYHIWRQRESYLYWLWEVREGDTRNLVRTDHEVKSSSQTANAEAGTLYFLEEGGGGDKSSSSSTGSNTSVGLRLCLSAACMLLSIFVMLPFLTELQYWILWSFYDKTTIKTEMKSYIDNIFALILVGMTNAIFILSLEPVVDKLAFRLAKAANHRTEDRHERAVVIKLFGLAFLFNFLYISFMTLIKGHFNYVVLLEPDFSSMFGWRMMSCGLMPCMEEAMVAIIFTYFAKYTFSTLSYSIGQLLQYRDPGNFLMRSTPIWETDYCLSPLNDEVVMRKYKTLLIQFAIMLFNFSLVPLLPGLFFFINIWTIRHWAEDMVVRHRRPLMLKTNGLGFYNYVLCLLPYFGAAYISLASSLNSSYFELTAYLRFLKPREWGYTKYITHAINFLMADRQIEPSVKEALKSYEGGKPPHVCMSRGAYDPYHEQSPGPSNKPGLFNNESSVYYYLATRKLHYLLMCVVMVILVGLICDHVIPHRSPDVEDTLEAEEAYARHGFQEDRRHQQVTVSKEPVPAAASPLP